MQNFKEFLKESKAKPILEAIECSDCERVATTIQSCIIEPIGSLVKKHVSKENRLECGLQ